MATLRQEPLSFPWEMFMQAQQEKNKNQRQMFQDIQGMGQGAGQIGLDVEAYKKKQKDEATMKAILAALGGQDQPPVAAPMPAGPGGGIPGGPTQNMTPQVPVSQSGGTMPQQPQAPDYNKVAGLAMQMDPSTIGQIIPSLMKMEGKQHGMNPYQQQSIDLRKRAQDEHAREFQQVMSLRNLLKDLMSAKDLREMKFKIQKYQSDNTTKNFLGFAPTEESVGVSDDGVQLP